MNSLFTPAFIQPRFDACFSALKARKRPALVTFTMASDPDTLTSEQILCALPEAGADIVELGIPFSDPTADGMAIQAAGLRAIQAGASVENTLRIAQNFRRNHLHTPLILMGYYNPILHYGIEHFVQTAKEVDIDGMIIVDLPPEEDHELYHACKAQQIAMIRLLTPTTQAKRLPTILSRSAGMLYYVSIAGITGTNTATPESINHALTQFRAHTQLPIAVGFGIKTPAHVSALKETADAIVVGSALVEHIYNAGPKQAVKAATDYVRLLSAGLD